MEIMLKNVRLSFPNLFTPKAFSEGQDAKYNASFLFPADGKTHKQVAEAVDEIIADFWKGKKVSLKGTCLNDGEEKSYDGYAGNYYLSASSKNRPTVVDKKRHPVHEEDGVVYAGCYVNALVNLWAMDNRFGKRVNAELRAVQFVSDGEAFGVPPVDVDSVFDVIDDEDEF